MTEQQSVSELPRSFDYSQTHDGGVKESFVKFSAQINELDERLGGFSDGCLKLGRVAGLLSAIKIVREILRRTRGVFFRNAIALHPELFELARKDCAIKSHDPNADRYFIPPQYFCDPLPPFDVLPVVLEGLGQSCNLLHIRIDQIGEFTHEALPLKSLLLGLEHDLMYRASCVRAYSDRLNTPSIQYHVHQFIGELGTDFEKVAAAFEEFSAIGISAISHEQQRSSQNLASILTAATFFSSVTASTLQMSVGTDPQSGTLHVASMLWFASLVFSVGATLNSLLAMAWKEARSYSWGKSLPLWMTTWINGSQLLFLGASIITFSAGLVVYAYSSGQALYTPYITVAATAATSFGLIVILIWMVYAICVSLVSKQQASIGLFSEKYIHSGVSGISSICSNRGSDAVSDPKYRDADQGDVEKVAESGVIVEECPMQKENSPKRLNTKLQESVNILGTAVSTFISAGHQHRRNTSKNLTMPKNQLYIDINAPPPMTQLNIFPEPMSTIDLGRYGTIRDIAYSEDGRQLAVTCAKEATNQSWTAVYNTESMQIVADTWHEGRVAPERLVWSPFGTKLIIKFAYRFDVWDFDRRDLRVIERHHHIKDLKWRGEDSFLVAEYSHVFEMNLTRLIATHRFEHVGIRSISPVRNGKYLIMIICAYESPEGFKPTSGWSERRIIIYDMNEQGVVCQVPVLEDIYSVHGSAGELDILITHKDQKTFQMWSLDAGIKDPENMAWLKKRNVTPHYHSGDYVGPPSIGGNYKQFIFRTTSTGIDIWRRESGTPYQCFEPQILQNEGAYCFSWGRSFGSITTFATAGADSHLLYIWRGEESVLVRTPEATINRTRWLRAMHLVAEPFSGPSLSHSVDGNSVEKTSGA